MNDVHALSGAYAVDALDDIERAMFERHIADCASCRAEVDSLHEAAAVLAEMTATAPPTALRTRVLADIAAVRPLPPIVSTPGRKRAQRTTHRRFPALAAAAAAVVALGVGGAVFWPSTEEPPPVAGPQLSDAELLAQEVLQAPDAEQVASDARLPGDATAVLTRSKSLDRAVMTVENMPSLPPGQTYELWLNHSGVGFVPAGLMDGGDQVVVLDEGADAREALGGGITVETEGGAVNDTPSLPATATFGFERT